MVQKNKSHKRAKKKKIEEENDGKTLTSLSVDTTFANMEGLLSFEELDGSAYKFYAEKPSKKYRDSDDEKDFNEEDMKEFEKEFDEENEEQEEEPKKKKKKKTKKEKKKRNV